MNKSNNLSHTHTHTHSDTIYLPGPSCLPPPPSPPLPTPNKPPRDPPPPPVPGNSPAVSGSRAGVLRCQLPYCLLLVGGASGGIPGPSLTTVSICRGKENTACTTGMFSGGEPLFLAGLTPVPFLDIPLEASVCVCVCVCGGEGFMSKMRRRRRRREEEEGRSLFDLKVTSRRRLVQQMRQ